MGEGLTSFDKDDSANFSGEKGSTELSKVFVFWEYVTKL